MAVSRRSSDDAELWARDWQPVLTDADRPDGQWPWKEHISRARSDAGWLALTLGRGSTLDGLLSLRLAPGGSRLSLGADIVYVEYIGIAPSHQWPPLGQRLIRGIGKTLMLATMRTSQKIGCRGRVGLHSKPDAVPFYRSLRMTEVEYEQTDDGRWLYFETTPDIAMLHVGDEAEQP